MYIIIGLLVVCLLLGLAVYALPVVLVVLLVWLCLNLYASSYFKGKKFQAIKQSISAYTSECNELNRHIEDLRSSYVGIHRIDYGEVTYKNAGTSFFKRKKFENAKYAPNIYDCSRTVCDNARKQPFKYVCKYFNIKENENSLQRFEEILNNFAAAEDGKTMLKDKRAKIIGGIEQNVPSIIKKLFNERLTSELGFDEFNFEEMYFPVFSFRYISAGGKSGTQFDLTLDIPMLERFVMYLGERVKFKKSVEGQRRLMTPKLRHEIIARDKFTCKQCGNSTRIEPNLLLEVDHIVPVSKGGMTEESNLQTLCWKCNRSKGAKLYPAQAPVMIQ